MDDKEILEFTAQISNFYELTHYEVISIFGYFLEKKKQIQLFSSTHIKECYYKANFPPPKNITDLLNKFAKTKRIIREKKGFHLSGKEIERIEKDVLGGVSLVTIKDELKELPSKLSKPEQQEFVEEILNCLRVKAWRGSIVLTWILTLDYLQKYVLENHLSAFNEILQSTKVYKDKKISKQEDFEEIKDTDFLKTIRTCGIIGKTKLKILENRLDERNRYAHPTDVEISDTIAISYIEDLVRNIILKIKNIDEE